MLASILESKSGVFLIAGLAFFALSFLVMAVVPWTMYIDEEELAIEQLADDGIVHEFVQLAERFPEQFHEHFPGGVTAASYTEALSLGRDIYVGEGCWHCHSQQIRPVSNEDLRWGPVARAEEYQNELQRPVLFGTRRVGPDLSREAARRSNDWHLAHFYEPTSVVPTTVMPSYRWFFDSDGYPNKRGLAIITYVQWLGSWLDTYPWYQGEGPGRAENVETPKRRNVQTSERRKSRMGCVTETALGCFQCTERKPGGMLSLGVRRLAPAALTRRTLPAGSVSHG